MSDSEFDAELAALAHSRFDAALAYARRGWAVFPLWGVEGGRCRCGEGCPPSRAGKHPIVDRWHAVATTDPAQIAAWWKTWPHANVALVTGRGFDVLDIDPLHDGEASLQDLLDEYGPLPSTAESLTGGGGRHLLFAVEPGRAPCSVGKLGAGLDWRGRGGYIVAPPSMHGSGRRYLWEASSDPLDGAEVATVPAWLLDLATRRERFGRGWREGTTGAEGLARVRRVPPAEQLAEGQRNDGLYRLGCGLRARGLDDEELVATLEELNAARCVPPLDASEVAELAAKVGRRPRGLSDEYQARADATERRAARAEVFAGRYPLDFEVPAEVPVDPESLPVASSAPRGGGAGEERTREVAVREPSVIPDAPPGWLSKLATGKGGIVLNTFRNVCLILQYDDAFRGRFRYNTRSLYPEWNGEPCTDSTTAQIRYEIEERWHFSPGADPIEQGVRWVAEQHKYHPFREYLTGLPRWDGVARVAKLAALLGVPDVPLYRSFLRYWLVSVVARVFEPGCKVDTVLILKGGQGAKKSTALAELVGREHFSDSAFDVGSRDGKMALHAATVTEIAEIDRVFKARDASEVKAFITCPVDFFRRPYGRTNERCPRSCVLVGTTNKDRFLHDDTGSRRYLVIPLPKNFLIDIAAVCALRDALWSEALADYRTNHRWWLTPDEERAREALAEDHQQVDELDVLVREWLVKPSTSLSITRTRGDDGGLVERSVATTAEVVRGVVKVDGAETNQALTTRVCAIMRGLGWSYEPVRIRRNYGTRAIPNFVSGPVVRAWVAPPDWRLALQPADSEASTSASGDLLDAPDPFLP